MNIFIVVALLLVFYAITAFCASLGLLLIDAFHEKDNSSNIWYKLLECYATPFTYIIDKFAKY